MKLGTRMVALFVLVGAVLMSIVSSAEAKGSAPTEEITKVTLLAAEPQVARLIAGDLRAVAEGKKTKIEAAKCAETKGMDVAHPLPIRILLLRGALGLYASEGDLEGTKRVTSVLEGLHCPREIIDETVQKTDVRFLPGRVAEVPKDGRYKHEEIHLVKAFGLNDAVLADTNRFPFAENARDGWCARANFQCNGWGVSVLQLAA